MSSAWSLITSIMLSNQALSEVCCASTCWNACVKSSIDMAFDIAGGDGTSTRGVARFAAGETPEDMPGRRVGVGLSSISVVAGLA